MLLRVILRVILLGLLLVPSLSYAAISCGDVTAFNDATPTDPETIPYTTPAGSNQVLFAGITIRHSTVTIDTPTHAGNNMTAVTTDAFTNPIRTKLWYIANPTAGTNNVVVNYSAAPLADAVVIWTCSGVDTTNPIRDFITATGIGTAVTGTVATVVTGDVVVDIFGTDIATTNPTIGANQTNLNTGNDGAELGWGASQQAGADGGVMSWTTTLSEQWSISAVAIKAASSNTRHIAPLVVQ
jgi:hypothetical protein